jgi:hypothetical protein
MHTIMGLIRCNYNKIYLCKNCNNKFPNKLELDKHVCNDIIKDNIYKFDINTFGKYIYPLDAGGDIYIIQTDTNYKDYYKIGITTNLINRLSVYRCGNVIEPVVHCYFPIKNIKLADKMLKQELNKYVVKREIYKFNDLNNIKSIIFNIQKQFESSEIINFPDIKRK